MPQKAFLPPSPPIQVSEQKPIPQPSSESAVGIHKPWWKRDVADLIPAWLAIGIIVIALAASVIRPGGLGDMFSWIAKRLVALAAIGGLALLVRRYPRLKTIGKVLLVLLLAWIALSSKLVV